MNNIFYTYLYRDINSIPIYVGKGKGKRAWVHRGSKTHLGNYIRKYNVEPEFIVKNVDEELAFFVEEEAIAKYGRKDLGTGTLFNRTNGGEGAAGYVFTDEDKKRVKNGLKDRVFTEQHRKNLSLSAKGNKNSKGNIRTSEHTAKLVESRKGFKHSEETKQKLRNMSIELRKKLSEARKGKSMSEETKAKMRETKARNKLLKEQNNAVK